MPALLGKLLTKFSTPSLWLGTNGHGRVCLRPTATKYPKWMSRHSEPFQSKKSLLFTPFCRSTTGPFSLSSLSRNRIWRYLLKRVGKPHYHRCLRRYVKYTSVSLLLDVYYFIVFAYILLKTTSYYFGRTAKADHIFAYILFVNRHWGPGGRN